MSVESAHEDPDVVLAALVVVAACKKSDEGAKPDKPDKPAASTPGSATPSVDAGLTDAEKLAKGMADADAEAAKEAKRWTPETSRPPSRCAIRPRRI